jgi:hypothetical protein
MLYILTVNDFSSVVKDEFFGALAIQLNKVKNHQLLIVAGDMSSKVGSRIGNDMVGQFGVTEMSSNGEIL